LASVRFQSQRNLLGRGPLEVQRQPAIALNCTEKPMNGVIYLVGLIVVVLFILSLFGLR
jgi:hypothetical protein